MADNDKYMAAIPSQTITRPANTTAYASGQLVANSTTAGSVTPFKITNAVRVNGGSGRIERVRLYKSGTSIGASFRVHYYRSSPAVTNGDGGAWLTSGAAYIGAMDVIIDRAFSDGAEGAGVPLIGNGILFTLDDGVSDLFALIEARSAYTPASGETFSLRTEIYRF